MQLCRKGYHTTAQGHARTGAIEGRPLGCRVVGLREADGFHMSLNVQDL
jgi:hypothetical protein